MISEHRVFKRLAYAPDDLYRLVSDIRRYPQFVKYINALRILSEEKYGAVTKSVAEARIRYKIVTERFTTSITCHNADWTIDVGLVSGPFRVLENRWRFHELIDGSTLIDFHIRYAFKAAFLQGLLDRNRDRAIDALIESFETEAAKRYPHWGGELAPQAEIDALIEQIKRG